MKRFSMFFLLMAVLGGLTLLGRAMAADAPDGPPPPRQDGGQGGPPPGGAGGPPPPGVHVIPPFVVGKLNLTDDQKKQIGDLEKGVADKLATILSADQMKTLMETRPPQRDQNGPPGGGQGGQGQPGGQGGPHNGGQGGQGGQGGNGGGQGGPQQRPRR